MAADFQAVGIIAQVVGVVDGPACEPQYFLFELAQNAELIRRFDGLVPHVDLP